MTKDEALKLALEALEEIADEVFSPYDNKLGGAILAIREALAQPHRKPLTDEQIMEMYNEPRSDAEMIAFARAIEAAHGIWPENSDCHGPDWTDRDGEYLK